MARIAVAGGTGTAGAYAVAAAESAGHDLVTLSRSNGIDVISGVGLAAALEGVDVIVDCLNLMAVRASRVSEFFSTTTRNLVAAGLSAKVQHLVSLSIVGIDRASSYPYYQGKLAQEQAVITSPLPWTIVRATQFHEFPVQLMSQAKRGSIAMLPAMKIQPIAASAVGANLIAVADKQPGGTVEIAGPGIFELHDLARRFAAARGQKLRIVPLPIPGSAGAALKGGALLAGDDAEILGPTWDDWLVSEDATKLDF